MIIADYHVHSDFSSDSKAPMEQMIEKGIQEGLKILCFTDHMDYDYPPYSSDYSFLFDPDEYVKRIDTLKKRCGKDIELLTGIELGLQPHLSERLKALLDSYAFDFVIGSSHVVDNMDPYYDEYWKNRSVRDGIIRYFESIIENCKAFQGFDVYGHIDYIVRYLPGQLNRTEKLDYSYAEYADILDEVLRTIIYCGKGIEINTGGLKYGHKYPHPKPEIIKRYKELGGELITIGSDAHKPEHLCYDFSLVPDLLKNLGFKYYAVFKERKPVYEKL
jgi:histidinol-phosphatase (PHP family)